MSSSRAASSFAGTEVAILGPFPPRPGGISVQCATLHACLAAAGARVTAINTDLPGLRRRGRWARYLLPLGQVLALLWRLRPGQRWRVLHIHAASWWGFMPVVLAVLTATSRRRLVVTYHGGEAASFLNRWGWLARPVLRRCQALLTLTPTQGKIFAQQGLPSSYAPNIVAVDDFPFRLRGPAAPRILWLRRFEPVYQPELALAVFRRVQERYPQATLTMAGGGVMQQDLRQQVERQHLTGITLLGALSRAEVAAALAEADLFLNTSSVDNLPLTLIEASASGLPIVSTAAGAIPDLIRDGENGLLAPIGDAAALSTQLLRLLADASLTQRLSQAARTDAERFTWSSIAPLLLRVYGFDAAMDDRTRTSADPLGRRPPDPSS